MKNVAQLQPLPVGSANSNISAPLNGSSKKDYGFHNNFSSSYHSKFRSPHKKKAQEYQVMNEYNEGPLTHKQKQLEEFNINLKQNKIKKYGQGAELVPQSTPILNKNLRRRLENVTNGNIMNNSINIHQSERKKIKQQSKLIPEYTPSAFENKNVSVTFCKPYGYIGKSQRESC